MMPQKKMPGSKMNSSPGLVSDNTKRENHCGNKDAVIQTISPEYSNSLWFIYTVSVISAWNAEIVTYPFDLIKTRLQIQGERAKQSAENKSINKSGTYAPHRGMLKTAVGICKEEGLLKLWQGIYAAFARHAIYSGGRVVTYKVMKEEIFRINPEEKYIPVWKSATCGVVAGALSQFLASPMDLLKVQLQMEGRRKLLGLPPRVHGMFDAFQKVWHSGGIRGLWKGSIPNVQRAALVTLGDLTTYDLVKNFTMRHTNLPDDHMLHIIAGACAGFVAALMGTPADVIKTRVMNQPVDERGKGIVYSSSIDCLKKTVMQEGFPALYKGFAPLWLRLTPWSLTFWLTYEEIVFFVSGKSW